MAALKAGATVYPVIADATDESWSTRCCGNIAHM